MNGIRVVGAINVSSQKLVATPEAQAAQIRWVSYPLIWAFGGATGCPNIGVSQDFFMPRHNFSDLGSGQASLPMGLDIQGCPRVPISSG